MNLNPQIRNVFTSIKKKNIGLILRLYTCQHTICKFFLVFFFILSDIICIAQTTYNVSPDGIGLSSLIGAKSDIRNQTPGMSGDITVVLADGTYYLDETLIFDVQDGGKDTHSVIYKAASGANPVISGGVKLTGWQQYPANTNIYRAPLTGVQHVRNIYVDGKRAKRSRGTVKTATALYSVNGIKEGLLFNKTDIAQYANPSNVEISYLYRWRDFYFLIQSIEDGAAIADVPDDKYLVRIKNFNWFYTMAYPVISPGIGGPMNQFYFENALELLDEPGEWYFDSAADMLYYHPEPGQDMSSVEVIAPKLEHLITINATSETEKVKNLWFEGIQFAHNSWDWPSENGFGTIQGSAVISENNASASDVINDQRKIKLPGAIQVEDSQNITFKYNVFTHLGSSGIDLKNNTDTVNIIRNTFYDISASAISVAGWEHRTIDAAGEGPVSNTLIKNNYIGNIGVEFASSSAIEGFYTSGMAVDHNELYNMPYSGISIGWGWHHSLSALANNSATNNKITGVIQQCYDGGGIYTLSTFDGNGMLIEGNYIDEVSLPPRTNNEGVVYTDEESSNITIKNNVVKSTRKWFFYNVAGTVSVDSMYVSSSTTNWGGNNGTNTDITLNPNHVWIIPNTTANQIQENSGIEDGQEPPAIPAENIALNKPTYSSSDFDAGSIAPKANDNSTTSFWHSGVKDQPWWYVDLGATYSLSSIELVTRQTDVSYEETRRNFVIEASNTSTFPAAETEILYTQGSTPLADRQILRINNPTPNAYRYIRVRKTVTGEHILIAELRVFGSIVESVTNVALNKSSFSSSNYDAGSVAAMANDNSITSFWHSGAKNKPWWYVDLGATYSISSIELVTRQTDVSYEETRRNFVIEASNSSSFPSNSTEILYTQGSIPLSDRATLKINNPTSNTYRYIRVRKTVTGEHMLIAELRVFGLSDSALKSSTATTSILIPNCKIYPNPVKNNLSLSVHDSNNMLTIKVITLDGKTVYMERHQFLSGEIFKIPTNELHPNIYLLTIAGENINITQKFIKE